MSADPRKAVDWEAIEREYRAGQLAVSEIGARYGCSPAAIGKRARTCGWTRDAAGEVLASHRADIARGRSVARALLAELIETNANRDDVAAAIEDDGDARRRGAMLRAVGLPSRAAVLQSLASTMKTLVQLERQAFGMGDAPFPEETAGEPERSADDISLAIEGKLAGLAAQRDAR
jgi:hypothetical protein